MNRFPPRRILVPFDCSPRAQLAWRHARALARRFGGELEALYVHPYFLSSEAAQFSPLDAEEVRRLQRCVMERAPEASAVRVAQGDVVQAILDAARESGAELIVMATQGASGWRRIGRESITEAVVRSSPVPVLVARGEPRAPRSVLAPVALEPYSLPGLWLAGEAARAFGARLEALHVAPEGAEEDPQALERLYARAASLGAGLRVERGRAIPRIVEEAARHALTVLVVHRRGLLRDAVLGCTAERVLRLSRGSVLTAPPVVAAQPPRRRGVSLRAQGGKRRGATSASGARGPRGATRR